ncbi:MAG: cyclase family protein [Alphaproteobacteria bacterium]|nr:cyclase family protein [Alphaproteobacteria bacterium]
MAALPFDIIDFTHPLTEAMPTWTGGCGFKPEIKLDYHQQDGDVRFRVQQVKMHCGIGTHMDAPVHCIPSGLSIDQLPLKKLSAPLKIIDVSHLCHERYTLSLKDIDHSYDYADHIVLVKTGWGKFWDNPKAYHNNHIFPSVSAEVTQFFADQGIKGLGIDTLSPDRPEDGFSVHHIILGAGKFIVENVYFPPDLNTDGALYAMALPIPMAECSEAPIRLVGLKIHPTLLSLHTPVSHP